MLARLSTYGLKKVILWQKYKVKSGQYGVLTLVFHVSQLKRCRLDLDHPERAEPSRGPAKIVDKPG